MITDPLNSPSGCMYTLHAPLELLCILKTETPLCLPGFTLCSCLDVSVDGTQIIKVITEVPYINPGPMRLWFGKLAEEGS